MCTADNEDECLNTMLLPPVTQKHVLTLLLVNKTKVTPGIFMNFWKHIMDQRSVDHC